MMNCSRVEIVIFFVIIVLHSQQTTSKLEKIVTFSALYSHKYGEWYQNSKRKRGDWVKEFERIYIASKISTQSPPIGSLSFIISLFIGLSNLFKLHPFFLHVLTLLSGIFIFCGELLV